PAALIMNGNVYGHLIWRCHIDTSSASKAIWRFLLPYINHYEGIVFTAQQFVKGNIQVPIYEICPSIDPLRKKNRPRSREEALKTLEPLFNSHNVDPERPIVAAVSRYDVHKNQKTIIRAFKQLKTLSLNCPPPLLIIVGNSASDDPEGAKMYETIKAEAEGDPDIHLWVNVENNDEVIGSLMAAAECFVHISTKEGFGLVVSEAMWQGAPVIGSRVGGIVKQVVDGYNGMLVNPFDADEVAKDLKMLLEDKTMRNTLSKRARETVRQHFLLPHMIKKELQLMRYSLEIDNKVPEFRMNKLTYKEINQALYGRTVWPFSTADLKQRIETIFEGLEQ
ncbi:MAG: glycosyltransferase, partial [Candidatus Omnitrophica bacterium]|nr:glycosyltransferase [Candidatus Omnitrophota bacterium]